MPFSATGIHDEAERSGVRARDSRRAVRACGDVRASARGSRPSGKGTSRTPGTPSRAVMKQAGAPMAMV
ncbi:Hypothetical protein A7982_02066 [Minicystis rosea]|nr:Hypothetical protein A7982_02066 [Minicystis rosea]